MFQRKRDCGNSKQEIRCFYYCQQLLTSYLHSGWAIPGGEETWKGVLFGRSARQEEKTKSVPCQHAKLSGNQQRQASGWRLSLVMVSMSQMCCYGVIPQKGSRPLANNYADVMQDSSVFLPLLWLFSPAPSPPLP